MECNNKNVEQNINNKYMEIKGKVHCFFEQSGTFKNEFIKLGIPAEDYDIQDDFGETDHVIDLFAEIETAYKGGQSVFDNITKDDYNKGYTYLDFMKKNVEALRLALN